MRYGSVCSGIEAATAAWHPLGWQPAFFSEIEAFPRAVLAHHYPTVPLHGDFTTIGADDYGSIELLVGGTPCQSFSVAGLRGGLDDDRGNLALEFLRLADRTRPRWVVWENVPGVLSSNKGRDFGSILGGLVELGYGFAYRVLDAQHFGVPQRRRRVFVVGCLGNRAAAAAVLFERHSLQGHPAPRRQARENASVCPTLRAGGNRTGGDRPPGTDVDTADSLIVTHSLRGEGFDASEDGTGRGTPLVPVAFNWQGGGTQTTLGYDPSSDTTGTLSVGQTPAVAFDLRGREGGAQFEGPHDTANIRAASGGSSRSYALAPVAFPILEAGARTGVSTTDPRAGIGIGSDGDPMFTLQAGKQHGIGVASAVRRLTPRECERLQGFRDDYTLVPYRNKPAADGPRYKALGNSMAVPVMAWIGERIQAVDNIRAQASEVAA